ncbi:tryptophan halogenase family protein [Catenovulum sp. SX2]|uniref:tryptophan halogenase family protein n=1 Tax=Catenovulum sp. SX2 TaxID=3398614 RepID=UPI003F843F5F
MIKKVVIVGGGSAGWMSAAFLSKLMGAEIDIKLVESDAIASVGVGEATIPPIQLFNNLLKIPEKEFLAATNGTIKLGIQFENWANIGDSYMHAFGHVGKQLGLTQFINYWSRAKQQGLNYDLWDFSLNYQAAKQGKFAQLNTIPGTDLPGLTYAYHFDAGLYAKYLRNLSEQQGVQRIEGKITKTNLNANSGYIESVSLESGEAIDGDLFLDCSGFAALLIGKALNTQFDDWTHYLPCDRAIAMPSSGVNKPVPYTRAIAHEYGWQWQIPLQHRVGNGLVYCSRFQSDESALKTLENNLPGDALADAKLIKFRTGRRVKQWNKNCIAIGLSSGFLEPMESTSLHMVQSALIKLIKLFPREQIQQQSIDEFNYQSQEEALRIRDFIILHYHLTNRTDSQFWRDCKSMQIPKTLRYKMELFTSTAKIFRKRDELFSEDSWLQAFIGQGLLPQDYHPMADHISAQQLEEFLANFKLIVDKTVAGLPMHEQYLALNRDNMVRLG